MGTSRTSRKHEAPLINPRRGWVALVVFLVLAIAIEARSPHPLPLKRIHHATSSKISILPRYRSASIHSRSLQPHSSTLQHSDTLLLQIALPTLLHSEVSLLLRPTEDLFHPSARTTYGNGHSERLLQENYRLYTGAVLDSRWAERIWADEVAGYGRYSPQVGGARIIIHDSGDEPIFEGVFNINGVDYHILTKEKYQLVKTPEDIDLNPENIGSVVIFRDSDMSPDDVPRNQQSCTHDTLPFNANHSNLVRDPFPLHKRDDISGGAAISSNFINSINSSDGCPKSHQIVYMGVALDCNYITTYGSADTARTQVLNDWNQISALYKQTFNISLGITELVVQNETCGGGPSWNVDCNTNMTLDERLSEFSEWRGDRSNDGIGLWHLMSACPTDSEVGVAWLGTICQTTSSKQSGQFVSGTGISTATKIEWSLISHEIGHGFGAIHDCTSGCTLSGTCCPLSTDSCDAGGNFIMNPTTSSTEMTFSPCTLGNICSNIGTNAISDSCLQTPGTQIVISLQQCGNGIVEAGEDCDPGSGTNSTCCDASTCKFSAGSVCDPTNSDCCTSTCQLASSGTVCRAAVDAVCDYAEVCSGSNATCPVDRTAPDGESCGTGGLACASGRCTSLTLQCQTAGASENLTTACGQKDDTSCVVSCKDPSTANQCLVLQTPLIDGSPCGYGGHCYNQTCKAGSTDAIIGAWYTSNLQIAIPVTVIAGLIVIIILWLIVRCSVRCCTRRKGPVQSPTHPTPVSMSQQPIASAPPILHRHANSVSSQDPIIRTGLISREPSPYGTLSYRNSAALDDGLAGYQQNVSGRGGIGEYGYQQNGHLAPHAPWPQPHASGRTSGWVDHTTYNGPEYTGR